jgi:hypothetical protein
VRALHVVNVEIAIIGLLTSFRRGSETPLAILQEPLALEAADRELDRRNGGKGSFPKERTVASAFGNELADAMAR